MKYLDASKLRKTLPVDKTLRLFISPPPMFQEKATLTAYSVLFRILYQADWVWQASPHIFGLLLIYSY